MREWLVKKRNEDMRYFIRAGARESDNVPLVPFVQQTRHYRECNGRRTPARLFFFSLFLLFFFKSARRLSSPLHDETLDSGVFI